MRLIYPQRGSQRLVWLTAFREASYWAISLLLSMGAVAEFETAEQDWVGSSPTLTKREMRAWQWMLQTQVQMP